MEHAQFSSFPHHSWFSWRVGGESKRLAQWLGTCHFFVLVARGSSTNRWVHRGRDVPFATAAGGCCYFPADGEEHTVCSTLDPLNEVFCLCIPRRHLADLAAEEGVAAAAEYRTLLTVEDPEVRRSLAALAAPAIGEAGDEHARALAVRMAELMGGRPAAWRRDRSVFAPRTMSDLVDTIDAHLHHPIPLAELAATTGLSPSHFARKFRRSSGLSLQRFAHLRRIQAAINRLQEGADDLARLALDLGFCSQSHLTRVFHAHTGMSPARFRRQFKRTVG